jgi:hypothetical protein
VQLRAENGIKPLANDGRFCYALSMRKVQEIESALKQLPMEERWEVARWLLEELEDSTHIQADLSPSNAGQTPPVPDYAARRRRIFGDKVLPNMVLVARAEERW